MPAAVAASAAQDPEPPTAALEAQFHNVGLASPVNICTPRCWNQQVYTFRTYHTQVEWAIGKGQVAHDSVDHAVQAGEYVRTGAESR